MVRFQFKKGLRFRAGLKLWSLTRMTATGNLLFEEEDGDCARISLQPSEVHTNWLQGKWVVDESSLGPGSALTWQSTPRDLGSLNEADRATATLRLLLIRGVERYFVEKGSTAIKCAPVHLEAAMAQVADEQKLDWVPHWSTFWRWWTKFRYTKCATRATHAPRSGRPRAKLQFSIFSEVIESVYLTDQLARPKEVLEEIQRRIWRMNRDVPPDKQAKAPSQASVYRWISELDYATTTAARKGKKFCEAALREVTGQVDVERILDRYEIDHTPVDVILICEKTWLPLGRPYLTLIIDRKSRMVAGFYASFHAPSASSVLNALRQAILPKHDVLSRVPGVRNQWPVRGCPRFLVLDNGMDLHADAVEAFCLEALIEVQFMPVAQPELKGGIERLFRTLSSDLFHKLPGTVFSSVAKRGDYPAEEQAALTMETFTQVLVRWIVDDYHCRPHRGLQGHKPLEVWMADEPGTVFDLPAFPRQLDLMVGHAATRTIFHYGIEYDCIRYSSSQLLAIRNPTGGTPIVKMKAYDTDVSFIDVLDPSINEYIRVPAVDSNYTNQLNRHVHSLIREQVRKRFGDEWTNAQLLEVRAEIRALVEGAVKAKRMATRKKAKAVQQHDSELILGTRSATAITDVISQVDPTDEAQIECVADDDLPVFKNLSVFTAQHE